jgi:hypothetical protein
MGDLHLLPVYKQIVIAPSVISSELSEIYFTYI